jgi:Flp pilus assembly protein CpaB
MPASGAVRSEDAVDGDRRRTIARPVLPSGRALVGALLLAVAAVGTFTAWQQASGTPATSYAVARRPLDPGDRLRPDDVRLVPLDVSARLAARAYTRPEDLIGRVALGPVAADELIQRGQLSDTASTVPVVEVSFALPRDRALDGRLHSGDRIDVFATYDDRTEEVVHGVLVVAVGGADEPSLTPDPQVTVTLALEEVHRRAALVHAVRAADVTLVRSTGVTTAGVDGDVYRPDATRAGPIAGPDDLRAGGVDPAEGTADPAEEAADEGEADAPGEGEGDAPGQSDEGSGGAGDDDRGTGG